MRTIFLCALLCTVIVSHVCASDCRFALRFTATELMTNEEKRSEFIASVLQAEGAFYRADSAFENRTAMTLDGTAIDYVTGEKTQVRAHDTRGQKKRSFLLFFRTRTRACMHAYALPHPV
jgi:hypothetical protein